MLSIMENEVLNSLSSLKVKFQYLCPIKNNVKNGRMKVSVRVRLKVNKEIKKNLNVNHIQNRVLMPLKLHQLQTV